MNIKPQSRFDPVRKELELENDASVDNTLAFIDQASFLWVRASGHVHCAQGTWVYHRAIDFDGLRRMQDNLAHGLLGRRVECSPLPFGRHRWVTCHEAPRIDIAPPVRTPAALAAWVEERAQVPIDPQWGPCWHIGVLPIEDYGTAVSLVASHTVIDGVGLCVAVADAAKGNARDLGYPPPRSRRWRRALVEDARQLARGTPEVAHSIAGGLKLAVRARRNAAGASAMLSNSTSDAAGDEPAVVPIVTAFIDPSDWDARAESVGGTSNSLFAGFAAKLAERIGRVHAGDGRVTLTYPVSDRTENDLRANALKSIDLTLDPKSVTADLREVRENIKQALTLGLGNYQEQESLLPLIPLVPKAVARKVLVDAMGAAALPVGCSNLGDIDPAVACLDGTEADSFAMRLTVQNITQNSPELAHGELHITSGRICGKLFISVRAYQPGTQNLRGDLCELVSTTLADFDLTGVIE